MKKFNSFLICFLLAATALSPLVKLGGNNLVTSYAETEDMITVSSKSDLEQIAVNVNGGLEDYEGKTIKLASDLTLDTWTPIGNALYAFKGTFDGDGHTISNIKITQDLTYQGLFGYTYDATIKNLSVVNFSSSDLSSSDGVYAGSILGRGYQTTIENCEVNKSLTGDTVCEIVCPTTLGSVAGQLFGGAVRYTSSFMKVNASYNLQNGYTIKVGGFVGSAENTKFEKASSFGGVNLTYSGTETVTFSSTFLVGGFAGEISGNNTNMFDCVVGGDISAEQVMPVEPSVQVMNVGAVAGVLISAQAGNIASVAYTTTLDAFKKNDANYQTSENFIMQVTDGAIKSQEFYSSDTFSFEMNGSSRTFAWYEGTEKWDFDEKWVLANNQLRLQLFQYFYVGLADYLDNNELLEKKAIIPSPEPGDSKPYAYNQLISMKVNFKDDENNKYYDVSDILFGGRSLNLSEFIVTEDEVKGIVKTSKSGDISFYKIENDYYLDILANNATAGQYSFSLKAIEYKAYIMADENGAVRYSGSSSLSKVLVRNMSATSNAISIEAVGNKKYKFNRWAIFYEVDEAADIEYDGKLWKKQEISMPNENPLSIVFSKGQYTQDFLLMANFEYDPCSISFAFDSTMISKIVVNSDVVSASSESVDLDKNESATIKVYVNENVEFDSAAFERTIKSAFTRDTLSLRTDSYKDNIDSKLTVYEYTFSTSSLNYELPSFGFTLSTKTVEQQKSSSTLWIILGSVGGGLVLVGVGLTIWLVSRKKAYSKISSVKDDDYKNYYY